MDFKIYATVLIFSLFGTNALCGQRESTTGQREEGFTERVTHGIVGRLFNDGPKKNTCEDIRDKTADNIANSRMSKGAKRDMGKENNHMYLRCMKDRVEQDLDRIIQMEDEEK